MGQDNVVVSALLTACAAGDTAARRHFQEEYGGDIYNFPVKIYGTSSEEAGDYYVYVFDRDRIFTRLRTFDGRNSIQFRTFLSYYVLKHLFFEWRRTCNEIETISLQTPLADTDGGFRILEDILLSSAAPERTGSDQNFATRTENPLQALTPEDQLYFKLLSLLEYQLSPEDVRLLAQVSERTVRDTLVLLSEIQNTLTRKDEKVAHLRDELDSVWGWIVLRQKELHEIQKQISLLSTVENIVDTRKLVVRKHALEHALAKRICQRERLIGELRTCKLTTPYRDIARLLNTTIVGVSSRIFRLREQLARSIDKRRVVEESVS